MKNTWNKVTPLSKGIAILLFITLPFIGFFLGVQYGFIYSKAKSGLTTLRDLGYHSVRSGHQNISYEIEGKQITLKNGEYLSEPEPGSATYMGVKYFGNEAHGDISGDGKEDVGFILTAETGGSGIFYYAVAAIKTGTGYTGTNAVFLGDRIAPQSTEFRNGGFIFNYADRLAGEPMVTVPKIGKSVYLKLLNGELSQVELDFEGEANPDVMTLYMKTWSWIRAEYSDGRQILPRKPGVFTIAFSKEGRFSLRTDCNSMSGGYTADKGKITFSQIASTLMYCEGSQESEFSAFIGSATEYHFTSRGELILESGIGSITFR